MSEILNLGTLCRCCHMDGSYKGLSLAYSFMGKIEVYVNMLHETFGLFLSQPPIEASHTICDICIERLRDALQFKKQIEECEIKFEDYCKNELTQQSEIKIENLGYETMIKPEIKIKYEDSNGNSHNDEDLERGAIDMDISHIEQNFKHEYYTEYQQKSISPTQIQDVQETTKSQCEISLKKHESNAVNPSKKSLDKRKILVVSKTNTQSKNRVGKGALNRTGHGHKRINQHKPLLNQVKTKEGLVHVCLTCKYSFRTKRKLRLHTEQQHSIFTCSICINTFESVDTLETHKETHKNTKHNCDVCGKAFNHQKSLMVHKNTHTRNNVFTCDLCNKDFPYKSTLKKHIAYHLGENKKFICEICGNSFNDRTNLNIHLRNVHEKIRLFKCDICPKVYARNRSLVAHVRTHTGERPYKCDACDKAFTSSPALGNHAKKHNNVNYTPSDPTRRRFNCISYACKICGDVFDCRTSFAKHTRSHIGAKPYKCHLCDKDFTCRYSQKRHIEAHTSTVRYPCKICHKTFAAQALVQRHVRNLHDPNKPRKPKVKCDLCKMSVRNMENHMKSHTGRSLRCDYCSKSYSERSALNRHVKERHCGLTHDCNFCDKKYVKAKSLRQHTLKKHNTQFKVEGVASELNNKDDLLQFQILK